jgi:hypothetical protein
VSRKHLLLLAAAVTDSTFERTTLERRTVWVGKWPGTQGGTNHVVNLATGCSAGTYVYLDGQIQSSR